MTQAVSPTKTRASLARLPDISAQENLFPPPLTQVYVPVGHQRALSLDSTIVVGMRGAGKSLWTAVLQSDEHRNFVAHLAGLKPLSNTTVKVGFGLDETNLRFPNASTLSKLASEFDAVNIWKAVILHAIKNNNTTPSPVDWKSKVTSVTQDPACFENEFTKIDSELTQKGKTILILFDALDRLAAEWSEVRPLLSGALRVALQCRTRRSIRLKFFLRPDMEEDTEIWRFPDSSKLRHSKVELDWRSEDLYSLLVNHLSNDSESGNSFRKESTRITGVKWQKYTSEIIGIPRGLTQADGCLRAIVESIAGPLMGRDKKRGYTYTWIPTHLADASGRVSPRSFLLAMRRAADLSIDKYSNHEYALHPDAIQQGVVAASTIRIAEIKEDYPWVEPLLEAARGMSVPCPPSDFEKRWTPTCMRKMTSAGGKLSPRRFTTDPTRKETKSALIDDLVELSVLYRTEDGRLNMTDIFRVGFGIKRKGGVKPPR